MDIEMILHDVNKLLYEHSVSKDLQEEYIIRFLDEGKREILEEIMAQYNRDYTCDFIELQREVLKDLNADVFDMK